MGNLRERDGGFTLVELMTVVLIIGILVTIAVPVYTSASAEAQGKSCQANQRTISGAADMYLDTVGGTPVITAGQFASGGSGWYGILIPGWIQNDPSCPSNGANYLVNASGLVVGDNGGVTGFKTGHAIP
jgi:prepilin-type N-terminal cleavage/methylation domain-containing protein